MGPAFEEKEKRWFDWWCRHTAHLWLTKHQPNSVYDFFMKVNLLVLKMKPSNKSQQSPNCPLLSRNRHVIVLIAVWRLDPAMLILSLEIGKLKAVILICWLLPAEGGHLPGKRQSSVWVAQQDASTARTSIEQLNLSFKGKSKRS